MSISNTCALIGRTLRGRVLQSAAAVGIHRGKKRVGCWCAPNSSRNSPMGRADALLTGRSKATHVHSVSLRR